MIRYAIIIAIVIGAFSCAHHSDSDTEMPPPTRTSVKWDMEEDGKSEARKRWLEDMHRTDSTTDWKTIEYNNAFKKYKIQQSERGHNVVRGVTEVFADGQVTGEWRERGSSNQAGSVIATAYHEEEDKIYVISAGGSLFKSGLQGLDWTVVNDDLRFGGRLLEFIEHKGEERLVAIINRIPHYSTDRGESWIPSTGIPINDRWGNSFSPIVFNDQVFVLSKPGYWSNLKLYRSSDGAETFQVINELNSHDPGLFHLFNPHFSTDLFMVEKEGLESLRIHIYNEGRGTFELEFDNDFTGFGEARANMTGIVREEQLQLFIYNGENRVLRSDDIGQTWEALGFIPAHPWSVGIYISPSDPDIMLAGAVECHRSTNAGKSWLTINKWGEYYGDVVNKLHADMMYFKEFVDKEGEPFLLISNHGGLSISRDGGNRNLNIGLYGLNVSQYYSVRTDPLDTDIVYAGSQDQGFQRGRIDNADWIDFDQVISGDYGHIEFTRNGQSLWTVYPGGWITYYGSPHTLYYPNLSYTIESENESVWIPPITPHPDPAKDVVFAAGGNINGDAGSYIIKLEVINNAISASQMDYDFYQASNEGRIGAIEFSSIDHNRIFVATTNGHFFYSENGGEVFSKSILKIPGSHYLYGTSILPSGNDESIIYAGGSGYNNPPVVYSEDGGKIFRPMSEGLPSTLVFALAANEDESMLFAATEAGPYVFIQQDAKWYDLTGQTTPAQTYWSVEYLPESKVARFGTYGRGIWDFEIEEIVTSADNGEETFSLSVYPNPTSNILYIHSSKRSIYRIYNSNGRLMSDGSIDGEVEQNVEQWPDGIYYIKVKDRIRSFLKI